LKIARRLFLRWLRGNASSGVGMSLQRGFAVKRTRKLVASVFAATLLSVTAAAPASAQPVVTGGLINITIVNVLNNNEVNVQVPIGIAANVCGIQANVLALGNVQEPVDCTASTTQNLPVAFRP
jgi:hypothetical protein